MEAFIIIINFRRTVLKWSKANILVYSIQFSCCTLKFIALIKIKYIDQLLALWSTGMDVIFIFRLLVYDVITILPRFGCTLSESEKKKHLSSIQRSYELVGFHEIICKMFS